MKQVVDNEGRSHHHLNVHDILFRAVIGALLAAALIGCSRETKKPMALRSEIDANDSLQLQALEGTGVFSDGWVGEVASISLSNPQHRQGVSIAGVNVQTGLKDESIRLRIEYEGGLTDSIEIQQTGAFEELLAVPWADSNKDTLQFRLQSSKSFVPAKLGTSQDDRTLSFRLLKIAIAEPAVLEKKMPASFEFPRQEEHDANLVGVYKDGWIAETATVTLYNLQHKKSIEIRGFVPPDVFTKVADWEIFANGNLLVKEQIPKQSQGYFRSIVQLPEETLGSSRIVLTLKPKGTFVPAERGINPDKRRISYQLQYIGLR